MKNFSVVVFSIISLLLNGGSELKSNNYVFHDIVLTNNKNLTILLKGKDYVLLKLKTIPETDNP